MSQPISAEEFKEKWKPRFPDQDFMDIAPADFRELVDDIARLEPDEAPRAPTGATQFNNAKPFYLAGTPVFQVISGETLLFYAKKYMQANQLPGGVIPTPDLTENEFWENSPFRAGSGAVARQVVGQLAYKYLQQQNQLVRGTEYLLMRQLDGERGQPPQLLPSVLVYATTSGGIHPVAVLDPSAGGLNKQGSYDVTTDTFTEGGGGGGRFPADTLPATAGTGLVVPGYVRANVAHEKFLLDLTTAPETPPTYYQPSAGLGSSPPSGTIVERGVTVLVSLSSSFSQGSAGAETGRVIKRGATVLSTTATASDSVAVSATVTYTVAISYAQGDILNGSNGTPYPGGRIPAGTVTASAQIIPQTPTYYGAVATSTPSGATMRGLAKELWGPAPRDVSFNCNAQYPAFAEPQSNGIRTVIKDKNGFPITGDVNRTALSVQLADGTSEAFWLYVHKNAQTDPAFIFKL